MSTPDRSFVAAASRGASVDVDALHAALEGVQRSQVEASVRWGATGVARGNRVMIERASRAVVERIFRALECPLRDDGAALLDAAERAGQPLIGGWDIGPEGVVAKLYANASDASSPSREALWRAAGWPERVEDAVPHLMAINAPRRGSAVRKAYVQSAEVTHAASLGPLAAEIGQLASRHGTLAGAVTSYSLDAGVSPRALFVGLRDGDGGRARSTLRALPGYDEAAIDAALPFERGQCRSVGVTLDGAPEWTAYFKPSGLGTPLWDLEPLASFRTADVEVSVFVAPREHGRAYATVGDRAISYRVTRGDPAREHVEALMRWIVGALPSAPRGPWLDAPPPPWSRVA